MCIKCVHFDLVAPVCIHQPPEAYVILVPVIGVSVMNLRRHLALVVVRHQDCGVLHLRVTSQACEVSLPAFLHLPCLHIYVYVMRVLCHVMFMHAHAFSDMIS